jgi:hypothetical protein
MCGWRARVLGRCSPLYAAQEELTTSEGLLRRRKPALAPTHTLQTKIAVRWSERFVPKEDRSRFARLRVSLK